MKRLFVSLLILAMLITGCSTFTGLNTPELTAEYYSTVYWGESMERERNGQVYIGREWKTLRVYPEKDVKWVLEERTNGDDVYVSMVWTTPGGTYIGIAFDDTKLDGLYNYCGVAIFATAEDVETFMNEFEGDGANVTSLVIGGHSADCELWREELQAQIYESKDKVIGE